MGKKILTTFLIGYQLIDDKSLEYLLTNMRDDVGWHMTRKLKYASIHFTLRHQTDRSKFDLEISSCSHPQISVVQTSSISFEQNDANQFLFVELVYSDTCYEGLSILEERVGCHETRLTLITHPEAYFSIFRTYSLVNERHFLVLVEPSIFIRRISMSWLLNIYMALLS